MTSTRHQGGRTPEELTTLLEDALIVAEVAAIEPLFEADAVLVASKSRQETHGAEAIALAMAQTKQHARASVAAREIVLRSGELAISIGAGIHLLRRGSDRTWRFVISMLDLDGRPMRGQEGAPVEWGR